MEWEPVNTKVISLAYLGKVLTPMVLYTAINFKLPSYVPYQIMGEKSCGIATSLVFYPPGYDGEIIAKEFNDLRIYYRAFISNDENHLYPGYTNFESILATLPDTNTATKSEKCSGNVEQSDLDKALENFFTPNTQITDFCKESFAIATTLS